MTRIMAKPFNFAAGIDETRREEEQKRLEQQATKLLRRFGFRDDGRSRTERSMSVRVVSNCNGPRD